MGSPKKYTVTKTQKSCVVLQKKKKNEIVQWKYSYVSCLVSNYDSIIGVFSSKKWNIWVQGILPDF